MRRWRRRTACMASDQLKIRRISGPRSRKRLKLSSESNRHTRRSFRSRGRNEADMKTVGLLSVIVMFICLQGSAQTNGNAENGKRLFMKKNCYYCHGTAGQGGRDGARIAQTSLAVPALIRYVRRPTGRM